MRRFKVLLCVFVFLLLACDGNYRDLVIKGQVLDSLTRQAIVNSEVNVTCWVYDTQIWESRKVVKDTITDAHGNFLMKFEKGEAIEVEVRHPNYKPYRYVKTLGRADNEINFKLKEND